ncbi:hypothetical protein [Sphingobacterium corticibacterium]|uniref:Uncharacterized protein n=1 Tax=Sphingobacterium corticibacterium TaxID=2484746 RepID=A0A4Q6XH32_9SPHI|nr:hypothetical protein [Sphingobacterium corticibacterium]RZF58405.1 hypothetical protein EWE74_17490 [Sphingobacterium corticibacterium]
MNNKELDKLFKEQLEQHTIPPRNDIWHQIENQLDREKVVPVRRLDWVKYAAIVVGCLGLIALLYRIMQPTPTLDIPIATQETSKSSPPAIPMETTHTNEPKQKKPKQQVLAKPETLAHRISTPKQKKPISEDSSRQERHLKLVKLKPVGVSLALTDGLQVAGTIPQQYVINVPPIAPLIDDPETEESMLASTQKPVEGIVPGILNKISDALNPTDHTTVQFSKDEEGFLRLDIVNSLVKNRHKKRR